MSVIFLLIPLSIVIGSVFLFAFIWAVRSGQYEDTHTPSLRILLQDGVAASERHARVAPTSKFDRSADQNRAEAAGAARLEPATSKRSVAGPVSSNSSR